MELILKQTIDSLGREGDIVKVKPGYARNYLLPQGKAVLANASNLAALEKNKAEIRARISEEQKKAEAIFKKLAGITLDFEELAGDDEKLFGSVSVTDIFDRLAAMGIEIEKKNIFLTEPIKTLGSRTVSVKVGFQMMAEISVNVTATQSSEG